MTGASEQPAAGAPKVVAALDIGASAIRMAIAEISPAGEIRVLETPAKPVPIGRDVFTTGRISQATRGEVIEVLRGFKRLMEGYRVSLCRVIATSALREAADRDTFLDWVYVRTGIDIEVIEGIEENQLTFAAVQHVLGEQLAGADDSLIMEVGGGSTELMILHRGEIVLSQTVPLGAVRMQQRPESLEAGPLTRDRLFRREIGGTIENIGRLYDLKRVTFFAAIGSDMRFVARTLAGELDSDATGSGKGAKPDDSGLETSTPTPERGGGNLATLPAGRFQDFAREVAKLSVDELVDRFALPFADAESLLPAMLIYSTFQAATSAQQVIVPMVSIRDGLLLDIAGMVTSQEAGGGGGGSQGGEGAQVRASSRLGGFPRQVIASAKALGGKYHYDEKHALHVTKLALRLFDELKEEHSLGQRERLILEVAGILHDIGIFIGNAAHHKHGRYIVCESDIFGLRKVEKDILADVVRYHRKSTPKPTHVEYMSLPRADRVVVSKLAAILRVADALDRAHLQRIKDFQVERRKEALVIRVSGAEDLSVERGGLMAKGDLFEEVFGVKVVLEEAP